ncbi:PP2C family serine/threonine-protein phosphatase [Tolypothrix sp. VBCCA 56010]|uniref:PP2C family serine/threonine-protein phosphatase n=1 Tax=Tolypothrix sp. VBCCA 56010 TaxID=3137731 RepID=UPI003D7EC90B
MAWRAVARFEIGTSHEKQQIPCQDYGHYRILNDVIVGAVADGAGSAKYSDVGAKLAVETVLEYLSRIDKYIHKQKRCWERFSQPSKEQAKRLFAKTTKKAIAALHKQADSSDYSINDLACTLLVFVATPQWVAAMQIGDGFMVVRPQDSEHQLLFNPDKGEFVNETTFITSANALDEMQVDVLQGQQEFICASTDGLEKVAIRMSDWTPFAPFFQPLEEYLWETKNPEEENEYVINFLQSERLNARTDDDKTLLLCLFDRQ